MTESKVLFKSSEFTISQLVEYIDSGLIALPELQRPFVWNAVKVRDLFDSLYKGMPIGIVILWEIYEKAPVRPIEQNSTVSPKYVVIDGQQRLTSLYAVIKGKEVLKENFKKSGIKIAFNLLEEKFEVSDAAIEKDPKWIPNITTVFENNASYTFINELIKKLKENNIELNEDKIGQHIQMLYNILSYKIQTIELSSTVDLEEVAEIFVRINSRGKVLNQSDFIMTLMSVYWDEGRKEIENFCKSSRVTPTGEEHDASPFNIIGIEPKPEHLVRSITAYGFLRGRLKYAYLALRGRDFDTEEESDEIRNRNFSILKKAQKEVLDLTNWHNFIKEIVDIGFVNPSMITSYNAFYTSYAISLLLNKHRLNVDPDLSIVTEWFAFSILTQRYTSSPESAIEKDLSLFKDNAANVPNDLRSIIDSILTEDYWKYTLPNLLETSSVRSPYYIVYLASLVYRDTYILFSNTKLKDYMSPLYKFKKKPIDLHHIFPKNYLKKLGITNKKQVNQVGNLVYVEYKKNIKISDDAPIVYWEEMAQNYSEEEINNMIAVNCLPKDFYKMDYQTFLVREEN